MKIKPKHILFACATGGACFVLLTTGSCSHETKQNATSGAPEITWQMPVEVLDTTQLDYAVFGWQSFVSLNWPADTTLRGKPDMSKSITSAADSGLRVWETFRLKEETFLPNAANPGAWNSATINGKKRRSFKTKLLSSFAKDFDTIPDDPQGGEFNQAGVNRPVIDQHGNPVMFEIAINESEYTYIVNNSYFNGLNQANAVHAHNFIIPPKGDTLPTASGDTIAYTLGKFTTSMPVYAQYGATEIKASWRILTNQDSLNRYYHRAAVIAMPDGTYQNSIVGLVGFHILRLTALTGSTWYWASFEQIDNVTANSGYPVSFNPGNGQTYSPCGYQYAGTTCDSLPPQIESGQPLPQNMQPVNVSRVNNIPAYIDSLNNVYQAALKGSVWANYELIGVLNPALGGNKQFELPSPANSGIYANVGFMANTTMETYQQNSSSSFGVNNMSNCVSCHDDGVPYVYQSDFNYALQEYQIFTFLLGDADTNAATTTAKIPATLEQLIRRRDIMKMRQHH